MSLRIGERLRKLRIANALTQEELANRAGLTKGYISQLERDLTYPSIPTLKEILDVLGEDLASFFKEDGEERAVFRRNDRLETADSHPGCRVEILVPQSQKKMDPVLVTLAPGERTREDGSHEGEEFGFVLKGTVALHLDQKITKLRKGDCFYFRANRRHFLENCGRVVAQIIWVVSPPTF
ncbi:transcriptional regulator with XRE-family HTH domain [Thermosulfuriphilus ammonigenes]|nr:cupin domain-containing protein [Thermosulfuriphilus ammonigenes]MBA2848948.1 transcriptional regulator with XRE-family HTH domain [Thermosulfuriphilus ammonigenes]